MAVTIHRLVLILAGAFAVAAIAFAAILDHKVQAAAPAGFLAMLLGTYGLGLGVGGLAFKRKG
jgi:hypothetical protein